MNESTNLLAFHDLLKVAYDIHIEDINRKVVLLAHSGGGEIHHLQALCVDFVVGNLTKLRGSWVFLRIGGLDAVYSGSLEHHVGLDLDATQ